MITRIALEGMTFYAFHGVYPKEQEEGNTFEVDIEVEADVDKAMRTDVLDDTVNYEVLYALVKDGMEKPAHLLEAVADHIVDAVFEKLPTVISVRLSLSKLNPPIPGGQCDRATLKIFRQR